MPRRTGFQSRSGSGGRTVRGEPPARSATLIPMSPGRPNTVVSSHSMIGPTQISSSPPVCFCRPRLGFQLGQSGGVSGCIRSQMTFGAQLLEPRDVLKPHPSSPSPVLRQADEPLGPLRMWRQGQPLVRCGTVVQRLDSLMCVCVCRDHRTTALDPIRAAPRDPREQKQKPCH